MMTFHLTGCTSEDNYTAENYYTGSGSGNEPSVIPEIVAPAEREDGTVLLPSEIGGYRVYYGTAAADYTRDFDLSNASDLQDTLLSLTPGATYYFVITAYDTDGRESLFSQELTITL
jgi:hypothetical protein